MGRQCMRKNRLIVSVIGQGVAHGRLRPIQTGGGKPCSGSQAALPRQQRVGIRAFGSDYAHHADKSSRSSSKSEHYACAFQASFGGDRVVKPGFIEPAQAPAKIFASEGSGGLLRQLLRQWSQTRSCYPGKFNAQNRLALPGAKPIFFPPHLHHCAGTARLGFLPESPTSGDSAGNPEEEKRKK